MSVSEKQKQSAIKYKKKNIKRVPLDMQMSTYERLVAAATATGMTVNGFIKQSINEKIEREGL